MFHSIGGLTQQEQDAQNTQKFKGDGTPYLKVPGLQRVEAVRVGGAEIPLQRVVDFVIDAGENSARERMTLPQVALAHDDEGTPILLRSQLSNDGIWQDGADIFVTGEWEAEAAEETRQPVGAGRGRRG